MPVYEFICLGCEERFDRILSMSAGDPACPSCGTTRVRRQLSMIAGLGGGSSGGPASACACGGACACRR